MDISIDKNKVKNLIKTLLEYYVSLENKEVNPRFYAHNEFDSNVTEFEGLSNSRRIIVKTSIDRKYIPGIMLIFQCIYDNNYWFFESLGDTFAMVDPDDKIDNETKNKIKEYELSGWIYLVKKYCSSEIDSETEKSDSDSDIDNDHFIGNNQEYFKKPNVDNKFYKSNKRQKVYTIEDIIKLVK
jgi:hypothetical protein